MRAEARSPGPACRRWGGPAQSRDLSVTRSDRVPVCSKNRRLMHCWGAQERRGAAATERRLSPHPGSLGPPAPSKSWGTEGETEARKGHVLEGTGAQVQKPCSPRIYWGPSSWRNPPCPERLCLCVPTGLFCRGLGGGTQQTLLKGFQGQRIFQCPHSCPSPAAPALSPPAPGGRGLSQGPVGTMPY